MTKGSATFPTDFKLEKVHYHWSTRSLNALGWFKELLEDLLSNDSDPDHHLFDFHNYLTQGGGGLVELAESGRSMKVQAQLQAYHDETDPAKKKLMKVERYINTHFERPNWDTIFKDMCYKYPGIKVGVFYCGPAVVKAELQKKCKEYSVTSEELREGKGTRFKLHAENF